MKIRLEKKKNYGTNTPVEKTNKNEKTYEQIIAQTSKFCNYYPNLRCQNFFTGGSVKWIGKYLIATPEPQK
ncbi:hypothetical protein CYANOKiyG1_78510 [Okeania sp. KiyG1]|nr:hypothetical protein CYANOKiyG1_03010 [Okeania sp. KiyG1]GGA01875.1 hypothetical protein CYANOKiyG1_13750 [Okeania sp. KiyG1]GGA11702.1 hypothetical protein CYANOKiyG1_24720 [Okeania sp. KiyG1]GGA56961.1 hypothetical protein CYANOKiyG1_77900 [Okeania sp. KiyG1]GGA57436.1 hypothetical protein CYANOKiyG1_78510 [Okeania sp. KiyG1]